MEEIISDVQEGASKELSRILLVKPHLMVRPVGKVELLVGSDCCQLLPKVIKTVGNLQLLENHIGYCVRGSFVARGDHQRRSNTCATLNHVTVSIKADDIEVSALPCEVFPR